MNHALNNVLMKVLGTLGTALLGALGLFLSRVLEPLIAWVAFSSMKLTIKLTKSKTLRALYGELKTGYRESKTSNMGVYGYNSPVSGPEANEQLTDSDLKITKYD